MKSQLFKNLAKKKKAVIGLKRAQRLMGIFSELDDCSGGRTR